MKHALFAGALALAFLASPALSAGVTPHCADAAAMKKAATDSGAKWIMVTSEEYHFLQGIFALNPATPKGLPYGDTAALVQMGDGSSGAMIVFIDGDRACTPMSVPKEIVDLMRDVATASPRHEGSPL